MSSQGGFSMLLSGAFVTVAVAAALLRPISPRDAGMVTAGMVLAAVVTAATNRGKRGRRTTRSIHNDDDDDDDPHIIQTIEELRDLMPAGASGTCLEDAKKVIDHLDDQMTDFVSRSPLLYLATVDTITGAPFVSPKGDAPGFVTVVTSSTDHRPTKHTLVIPDRPGNRLVFGLQNIVGSHSEPKDDCEGDDHQERDAKPMADTVQPSPPTPRRKLPRVSVLFEVPGTGATLRCGGTARLSRDPVLLANHTARRCPPKLVILVDVDHAFFHCAKAYMRSKMWDPASWPSPAPNVTFGRYFAKKDSFLARTIDSGVDKHYREVQKAIDGEACEKEA